MLESFTNQLMHLLQGLNNNQTLLYFYAFLLAMVESLPVVGTFMPGTFILLLFGFIAANGHGSLLAFILLSVLGATVGDILGYIFGRYGRKFFKEHSRILKLSHIHSGEVYFAKHGGKSVFFGRFIGPIRPIISLIAGATHMFVGRFLKWNISGAFVWAATYISLGYLFAHNIRIIDRIVSEVGTAACIVIIVGAGCYLYYKKRAKIITD